MRWWDHAADPHRFLQNRFYHLHILRSVYVLLYLIDSIINSHIFRSALVLNVSGWKCPYLKCPHLVPAAVRTSLVLSKLMTVSLRATNSSEDGEQQVSCCVHGRLSPARSPKPPGKCSPIKTQHPVRAVKIRPRFCISRRATHDPVGGECVCFLFFFHVFLRLKRRRETVKPKTWSKHEYMNVFELWTVPVP